MCRARSARSRGHPPPLLTPVPLVLPLPLPVFVPVPLLCVGAVPPPVLGADVVDVPLGVEYEPPLDDELPLLDDEPPPEYGLGVDWLDWDG
jgi:hypothetical protein